MGGPGSRGWRWLLAFWLLAACTLQAGQPKEYEVKAAFLFNFAKFVDWPAKAFTQDSAPVVFGILGEDPFGKSLPAIVERETVKGRKIEIRHYQAGDDFSGCHILFVSRSEGQRAKEILEQATLRATLTVGDAEDFSAQGGMINFVLVDQTVRFDINLEAAARAGLKISSKLLAVAHNVRR